MPDRPPTAEFDRHAAHYDGGLDNSFKRLVSGRGEMPFIGYKTEWLQMRLPRLGASGAMNGHILDYGCGTGDLLSTIHEAKVGTKLTGFDISTEMIGRAKERFRSVAGLSLASRPADWTELPGAPFDLAIVCCVLHHVEPEERPGLLRRLVRQLKPGGWLVIFEHNPFHPIVQWVVRHTEIDRNAKLLSARETRRLLNEAGFQVKATDYLLFGPPGWRALRPLERALRWLPMGGQYAVVGRAPE
jgi:SAM-dependent methyltransferase